MSKKKTPVDPVNPPVELNLDGKVYKLCFDFAALAEAESHFIRAGHHINLLAALPKLNLSSIQMIFPCALHRHHPEIGFVEAQEMVNISNVFGIASAIAEAWQKAMPEAKPDPTGAVDADA
ncbi:MAG TPA: hypothetical protein VKX41_15120 [Alloacidobacterium sp.]|jgi:hypothetical protein|nr:hypothetical protein [Alloacidobacterium sp.]